MNATDTPHASRAGWLLGIGAVLFIVGIARLVLDASATVLGTSVSCGNAADWLAGNDNGASRATLAVCGAPLHNASVEGAAAAVAGVVLMLGWLVAVRAHWPLVALAAFIALIVVALAAGPLLGAVVALAIVVAFGAWRAVARHRYAERGR